MKRKCIVTFLLSALLLAGCSPFGKNPDAFDRGRAAYDENRLPEAIEHFRDYCDGTPDDALGWYNLGLAYQDNQQLEPARDAYRRALIARHGDARTRINLSIVLDELGESEAALNLLTEALEIEDARAYPLTALANYFQKHGDSAKAEEHYLMALSREADHAETLRLYGNYLVEQDRAPESLPFFQQAQSESPEDTVIARDASRAAREANDHGMALGFSNSALSVDPSLWEEDLHAASSAVHLERYEDALKHLWRARSYGADENNIKSLEEFCLNKLIEERKQEEGSE